MSLSLRGTIDTMQFYPTGISDADTIHVAIKALPSRNRPERLAFDAQGRVTVRLRGVDAPELHERPRCPMDLGARERAAFEAHVRTFRQPHAIRSITKLSAWLSGPSEAAIVPCTVRCEDFQRACDPYGRLVGDLFVHHVNVNLWMLRQGLAFPALYASIPVRARKAILEAAEEARRVDRGVWAHFTREVRAFDPRLVYPAREKTRDSGSILWPKLFRMVCAWYVARRAGICEGALRDPLVANGRLIAMPQAVVLRG